MILHLLAFTVIDICDPVLNSPQCLLSGERGENKNGPKCYLYVLFMNVTFRYTTKWKLCVRVQIWRWNSSVCCRLTETARLLRNVFTRSSSSRMQTASEQPRKYSQQCTVPESPVQWFLLITYGTFSLSVFICCDFVTSHLNTKLLICIVWYVFVFNFFYI